MEGYNAAFRTLRWDCLEGGAAELLRLLREHAGTLRELHVALVFFLPFFGFLCPHRGLNASFRNLKARRVTARLLEIVPSCVSLTALEFL